MPNKKGTKMRIRTNSSNKPPSPVIDKVNSMPSVAFVAKSKNRFKSMLEDIERDRNLTLKDRFDIFLSETSFTALTKIFKAGTVIKQIIWLVLVLAMMSWLCVQCYWLFSKYFSYPYEVKTELFSQTKMEFPSVTVCNRNPIRKSKIRESPFYQLWDMFEMKQDKSLYDSAVREMKNSTGWDHDGGSSEEDLSVMTQLKNRSFNVWSALENPDTAKQFYKTSDQEMTATFAYAGLAAGMDKDELKQYGHQIEDFLVACRYRGVACSPENFTYVHNVKYGNCYTFNAFNNSLPTLQTTHSGPLMGLALELNIQQWEYLSALAPDAGVRVLVHSRGTYPALEDDGFSVPVGAVTSVGIRVTEVKRLPPPHASCANSGLIENLYMTRYGVKYEKSTCLKTCQQYRWQEVCGCAIPLYELPDNASICSCTDEVAEKCLWEESEKMHDCQIKCPTPCFEKKYEPLISIASWPSESFEDILDYKLTHASLDFMSDGDDRPESDENLAKIEVYLRELMYESIEQQKAYESQNLISDVGGQLGLWLGLSAITLGEMVEFFMAVFKAITAKAVGRKHRGTVVESLESGGRKLSLKDLN